MEEQEIKYLSDQEIIRLLHIFAKYDEMPDIWVMHEENEKLVFYVNCNDVFGWACADAEPIEPDDLDDLEQAYIDSEKAAGNFGDIYATMLWAARKRKMRPQGAIYPKDHPGFCKLLDECGPERDIDFLNPKDTKGEYKYKNVD